MGKQYDTVMIDNSSLRGLLRFTVMLVRAVLWLKEFLNAHGLSFAASSKKAQLVEIVVDNRDKLLPKL